MGDRQPVPIALNAVRATRARPAPGLGMLVVDVHASLGVGRLKMKVHKQAVASLYEAADHILETRALYDLALKVAGIE